MPNSPNRAPYQRGTFAQRLERTPDVHVLHRGAHSKYFKAKNPDGFQHDLGAQDVFLDNLGIACFERIDADLCPTYFHAVAESMVEWERTRDFVLRGTPWTGKHIDAKPRAKAAAGEPRARLRLLQEDALRRSIAGSALDPEDEVRHSHVWPGDIRELFGIDPQYATEVRNRTHAVRPHGLILPEEFATPVSAVRLLPIKHCTPDLPARVGLTDRDLRMCQELRQGRDQGGLGTCASFATTFAVELAAHRANMHTLPPLSTAWIHLSTGTGIYAGRTLRDTTACVRNLLPCSELDLPYAELEEGRITSFEEVSDAAHQDSEDINIAFGTPECVPIPRDDIATMKTLLAAGWVLLLGTAVHEDFQRPGAMALGLPLLPLIGARRIAGHAWCVFGYDHADGALNWKYQGRFVALNSWGPSAHPESPYGPGTISLPFSHVWQHGFEAFAVRFPRR